MLLSLLCHGLLFVLGLLILVGGTYQVVHEKMRGH